MKTKSPEAVTRTEHSPFIGRKFGEILVALGKIDEHELESILITQKNTSVRIGEFLLQRNIITEDDQLRVLSYQLGIEYNDDLPGSYNLMLSSILSRAFTKKHTVLVIAETDRTIDVAINDPFQFDVIENIRVLTGKEVNLVLAKKLVPILVKDEKWRKEKIDSVTTPAKEKIARARFAVYGDKAYPDATFTLRMTFGTVRGYPMNGTQAPPFTTFYGLGSWFNDLKAARDSSNGPLIFFVGALLIAYMMFGWFGSVVRESRAGLYSAQMDRSFRWGMSWFIFSEVMFFLAFFGALFYIRYWTGPWLAGEGDKGISNMLWPPNLTPFSVNTSESWTCVRAETCCRWATRFSAHLVSPCTAKG